MTDDTSPQQAAPQTTNDLEQLLEYNRQNPFSQVEIEDRTLEMMNRPPVTQADFEKYKHEVATRGYDYKSMIDFNDRMVNVQWLQYNLFQYYLPESERSFFHDEHEYHRRISHSKIQNRINAFLKENGISHRQYIPPQYRRAS
jgi:hypothetical protein